MRLLIVEDEPALAGAIQQTFKKRGFNVDLASNVEQAMDAATTMAYDCIVMDVMLPDGNGINAVEDIREFGCNTGILILTVQNDLSNRVRGLNAGADDYLGKPFHTDELVARVESLIRRTGMVRQLDTIQHGRAILHSNSRTLSVGSATVELSSKEFALLEYLFRHPGQIITRDQLIVHVWGPDTIVSDSALDTYIYFLRKKAFKLGFKSLIKTIRGQGYALSTTI